MPFCDNSLSVGSEYSSNILNASINIVHDIFLKMVKYHKKYYF